MLIAINKRLIDKPAKELIAKHNGDFSNVNVDAEALAAEIKQGHAFCPQHTPGKRRSSEFIAAGYLAVDVDRGLRLEAAIEDQFVQRFATIIYTTPSHTADSHRFRVVFELEEPIRDAVRMQQALSGLIAKFGGDESCKDACRLFFGSTASSPVVMKNRLPTSEVDLLALRGREHSTPPDESPDEGSVRRGTVRSRLNIPSDSSVRTADGRLILLRDAAPQTRIFCPQHIDQNPSAFTLRNKHGNPGLYCSACVATYFLESSSSTSAAQSYRFDYHWNKILDISYEEYTAHADDEGHVDISAVKGKQLRIVNQRHLKFSEFPPLVVQKPKQKYDRLGMPLKQPAVEDYFDIDASTTEGLVADYRLTLVRSPKGTGKTEWLGKLVENYKAHGVQVLLIGHRRALISATAVRVGLTSYLGDTSDDPDSSRSMVAPAAYYAVCVDSLPKMDPKRHQYEVVLIDEVEQVFAHLLSSTLKEDRRKALHILKHYIRSARAVYVLDADLSNVTVELLHAIYEGGESPSYQAIINQWQPNGRTVELWDGAKPDALVGELAACLNRGERCFVCSNSKKLAQELLGGIQKTSVRPLRTLLITSDNSQDADIQSFIQNIKSRAMEYDLIVTSPALGTGIDITFADDAQNIDVVLGFFRARINTHFDIDQQLARVRNPKRVCVWISPETYSYETDSEAIKAELLASEQEHQRFLRVDPDGTLVYDRDEFYETVYAEITASRRASKNRLKEHFVDLKQSNGWTVISPPQDKVLAVVGKELSDRGKQERRSAEFERILRARRVATEEYEELRRSEESEKLAESDKPVLRRYEIESFYIEDVSLELLQADNERRLRSAILMHENLMDTDDSLRAIDIRAESSLMPDKPQRLLRKKTLQALLTKAQVMRGDSFVRDAVVDSSCLQEFAGYCSEHKVQIERLFDVPIRGNVRKDPVTQLKSILKPLGLTLQKQGRDQSGGASKIFYKLNVDQLDLIQAWMSRRRDPTVRDEWESRRAATT
jgi:hypothetical protein